MSKKFHIGDIISITTGVLVSPNKMQGIYDILNYMTGDDLVTCQLPWACEECKPFLLEQMPWLSEISADKVNSENWESWLSKMVEKYGEFCEVKSISEFKQKNQP